MTLLRQRGFTLVEILVILTVMTIIATMSIVGFQDFARFQRYEQSVAEIVSLIEESRTNARSAVGEERHGIKLFGTSIVQFSGDSYIGANPSNVTTSFNNVTLIPNFQGATDEIIFAQLTAVPTATGTIDIINSDIPATTTISITAAGVIQ